MPTYDYRCTVCGYVFEHFQSMFDEPLKACPRCQSEVKRVISGGSGLIFKGSGFYITDYKSKPVDTDRKSESGSKKTTAKANSGKTKSAKATADKKAK